MGARAGPARSTKHCSLCAQALPSVTLPPTVDDMRAKFPALSDPAAADVFSTFLTDLMLFNYRATAPAAP